MTKKIATRYLTFILAAAFVFAGKQTCAQDANGSGKNLKKWYDSKAWLGGLLLQPHISVNKQEFARQYQLRREWWDRAFAYLKETNLAALQVGDHPIVGDDVFARVTEVPTKEFIETKWEAHRKYSDIHYVIRGKEKMGMADFSTATVIQEYDPVKDIGFYNATGKIYESDPNSFFIAFPSDAHRPGIKTAGAETIKKVVIKIRKAE